MKKIFSIILFLIFVLHVFPANSFAANVNPNGADKCYYCEQISIGGFTYDGVAVNLNQCLPEYEIYPAPGGDECENQNENYVGYYVCKYDPTNGTGTGRTYMTLAKFPSGNGGKCTTNQICIPTLGCQTEDTPDPATCGIMGNETVPCDSKFDCTNNDPACSNNWCVNPEGYLFSEEDLNGALGVNGGRCKKTTSASPPTCKAGQNCDYSTFNTEGPRYECNGPSDCFSNDCNMDTHTCNKGVTLLACKETREYNSLGVPVGTGVFTCETAIGRISTDPEGFAQSILRLVLGLAGGILLVLIILNGYKLMMSQGDPEKIKEAREAIISAIAGLLLIIFSLAILRIITVEILKIPGFS